MSHHSFIDVFCGLERDDLLQGSRRGSGGGVGADMTITEVCLSRPLHACN